MAREALGAARNAVIAPVPPDEIERRTPRPGAGRRRDPGATTKKRLDLAALAFAAAFVVVLLFGAALRFNDLNWDQGQHLHPDERSLTQVLAQLRWPSSFGEYLDESFSPLNPRNVGFSFFAYGTLPTTVIKGVSLAINKTAYDDAFMVGRALSALLDTGSLALVFLLALRLYRDRRVALLAMFLFATTVLAIQQAHFMVVDGWATFFMLAACYCLVGAQQRGGVLSFIGVGAFFGLALASKLSVFTFAAVVALVGIVHIWQVWRTGATQFRSQVWQTAAKLALSGIVAFVTFRLGQPDAFTGPGFFDLGLSPRWLDNLQQVTALVNGSGDYPPGDQWTNRTPLLFPWLNMVLLGLGLPLGLAAWSGWGVAVWRVVRRRELTHLVPVAWVGILFLHQGTQWVKSLRYFLPIYPLLAVLAGWLLIWLWDRALNKAAESAPATPRLALLWSRVPALLRRLKWTPQLATALIVVVAGGTLLWALAFSSIYTQDNTRVRATHWVFANIPLQATIGVEYWDDALPIRMDNKDPFGNMYKGLSLYWYDNDSPDKLQKALGWLDQTDYLVLSSNRLYDSISRMPTRYPMTIRYYQALFDGSLGFQRIAEFTSYPSLLGLSVSDQGGEEAFSVYDHPRVQIFKKTAAYSRANTARILAQVDWSRVVPLNARQATVAPTGLFLPPDMAQLYSLAGTWSQLFNGQSFAAAFPPLAWALILELLGLFATPYMFFAARGAPDRGYSLAKILGLLLPATAIWLLASFHLVSFERSGILLVILVFGAGAVWLAYKRWPELRQFWRERRKLLMLEEALFWACFAAFLLIRVANPDLWHNLRGGEKPMDLAFLTAVTKSPYFPPYDPWFAGGFINYYYFGFVPVAMLIKLSGIAPDIAYNLAVPSMFALTALGAFGVALGLVAPKRRLLRRRELGLGLLGALFVVGVGNLAEFKVLGDGFAGLAGGAAGTGPLDYLGRIVSGAGVFLGGKPLPVNPDWWFWNASRVITHPATESGPINEFPLFTFLFADLHAHMLDLPFTLLTLGLAVATLRAPATESKGGAAARLGLLTLATGVLWAANTWDFPTFSLVTLAALVIRYCGALGWRRLWAAVWRFALVVGGGYLLFLPFHQTYGAGFDSAELWQGSRTPINEYLLMHGLFLFLIVVAMLADFAWGSDHNGLARTLQLRLRYWRRLSRLRRLERLLLRRKYGRNLAPASAGAVIGVVVALCLIGQATSGLIVALLALSVLLLFRRRAQPLWQFALFFAALGLALTLLVEWVVLKGDIGRLNTVFKFYFQVWSLFALAATVALGQVWRLRWRLGRFLRAGWTTGFAVLLAVTLLYPLLAIPARVNDRMNPAAPPSLDGSAFLQGTQYTSNKQILDLAADKKAIAWVQSHVAGSPVIAEANTYPTLYGWGNRFTMFTGLPGIIGWDFHERQQRAIIGGDVVAARIKDVQRLYATPDAAEAHNLLLRYNARLLIVGGLERSITPAAGIAKFSAATGVYWDLIYDQDGVQIYSVRA